MGINSRRRYDDRCGIALAMDILGERWSVLIVRDLLLGPKRFTDLQAGLSGISPNVLSQRLRDLQDTGVVRLRKLPPPAGSRVYELTAWGAELEPVITALGMWGVRSPVVPLEGIAHADSLMLTLRTSFRPDASRVWTAGYEIRLGTDVFDMRVVDGRIAGMARGHPAQPPDATLTTDTKTLAMLVNHRETSAAAIESGRLTLTGDIKAARKLLRAVGL